MNRTAMGLGAVALLGVAAVLALAHIGKVAVWDLWLDSGPFVKLAVLPLLLLLLTVLVLGALGRATGDKGGIGGVLKVLAWIGVAIGVLATLPNLLMVWTLVQRFHPTRAMVYAPGLGEALLPLTLGLIIAAIALFLRRTPASPAVRETR